MKNVLLLLAEGFEVYEASAFVDVMGWNLLEGDGSTRLFSCGRTRELGSSFGQRAVVDLLLSEVDPSGFAALAVPGGFEEYGFYRDALAPDFSRLIARFHEEGKPIASICTGAFPVAKSGALRGGRGTTYNLNPARQAALRELGVEVVNEPVVVSGNVITSWNPSTALDVAFLLLERLTSAENAKKVKGLMGFGGLEGG